MNELQTKVKIDSYKNIFQEGPVSPKFIVESIQKHSKQTDIGAHGIFLGQVRADGYGSQKVIAIDYSCYKALANNQIKKIREYIFAKFELTCLHITHSLGKVGVGEICLFVFSSSPHRKQALDACAEVVEKIKMELPIWGKEILENGEIAWKKNI